MFISSSGEMRMRFIEKHFARTAPAFDAGREHVVQMDNIYSILIRLVLSFNFQYVIIICTPSIDWWKNEKKLIDKHCECLAEKSNGYKFQDTENRVVPVAISSLHILSNSNRYHPSISYPAS